MFTQTTSKFDFKLRNSSNPSLNLHSQSGYCHILILTRFNLKSTQWVRTEPERLRERRAALVLSVGLKSGGDANVVIIVEHKSTPHKGLMEQLNRYHAICSERGNKFIMPVVVYHGKTTQLSKVMGELS